MSPPRRSDRTAPLLLLLLSILSIYCIRQLLQFHGPSDFPCREKHYVQIGGDVSRPGVLVFCKEPSLREALASAGLGRSREEDSDLQATLHSGARLVVKKEGEGIRVGRGEMNGFFKMTLAIPLSINSEPEVGLTALPGVGPGLAKAIAEERSKRGGFKSLEDLTSVRGIGHERFMKIRPYVRL